MSSEPVIVCPSCGAEVSREAPEYYVELECFRIIAEQGQDVPRRGSEEYHEAIERLLPKIREEYFKNREMYDGGHLWCPACGARLQGDGKVGLI